MAMKSGKGMQPPSAREANKAGKLGGVPVPSRSDAGQLRGMQSTNPIKPKNPMRSRKTRTKGV